MQIKKDDWIEVEYTGKLKNGDVFDTSKNREPLKFKVGSGMVIPGFDAAVVGLEIGGKKTFTIPCSEAYGDKNTNVVEIPKASFKENNALEKGKSYNFMTDMGPIKIDVEDILDDKIKAIVNHPLAGEDLEFEIEIKNILSPEESLALEQKIAKAQQEQAAASKDSNENNDSNCDDDCKDGDSSCDCGHDH